MNKKILSIALFSAAIAFTACNNKKETVEETTVTEVADTTATPAADAAEPTTVVPSEHKDGDSIEVTGEVTEINKGKDGYTAKLKTADNKAYSATISIPNMTDPKQFRAVNVGDKITVKGEVTNLEADVIIVVRELK